MYTDAYKTDQRMAGPQTALDKDHGVREGSFTRVAATGSLAVTKRALKRIISQAISSMCRLVDTDHLNNAGDDPYSEQKLRME